MVQRPSKPPEPASPEEKAFDCLALGIQMENMQDFSAAATFYEKGLSFDPESSHVRYFLNNNLGYSLNQLGRFTDAEPYCRAAIAIQPRRYNAHKNLGVSFAGEKRYAEASSCFVQATRLCPSDRRALHSLERLVTEAPETLSLVPGLEKDLEDCRALARMGSAPSN